MQVNSGDIQKYLDESGKLKFDFVDEIFPDSIKLSLNKSQQRLRFRGCTFNNVDFIILQHRCALEFVGCSFKFNCQFTVDADNCQLTFDATVPNIFFGGLIVIANRPLDELYLRTQKYRDATIEFNGRYDSISIVSSLKEDDSLNSITLFGCNANKVNVNFLRLTLFDIENSQISSLRLDTIVSNLVIRVFSIDVRLLELSNLKVDAIKFEGNNKVTESLSFNRLSYIDHGLNSVDVINIEINNTSFLGKTKFIYIQSPTIFFSHCTFSGPLYFDNINSPRFVLHATSIAGDVFVKDVNFGKSSVETFTILKSKYINQNDRVNELVFRKNEFEALLQTSFSKEKFSDVLILLFSKISNNYGTRWDVGVCFTLIASLFFYFIYISLLGQEAPFKFGYTNWDSFVRATKIGSTFYFKFLDITHDTNFVTQQPISLGANLIDFLGRIFIAFGFYQTIQAFRKFGKDNQ